MRRGHYLESEINRILKYLNSIGIHGHKNHANRTHEGKYLDGECFDYEVISGGKVYCFDAKEVHSPTWNLKTNAKLSQIKALYDTAENGAEAFFLVWFAIQNKIIRFDIYKVRGALEKGVSSLKPEDGSEFDWRIFLN